MPLCDAKAKSTGHQCGNLALDGQTKCRIHGGGSPQAKRKAKERKAEQQARRELSKLEALLGPAEPVANPLLELQQLAGEAKRWRELMAGRVSELTSVGYEGVMGEQTRHEVQLLERATDRLAAILTSIARLNIDERIVAINSRVGEQQAEIIFAGVGAVLDWLGLTPQHRQQAMGIIASRLRSTQDGTPPPLPPSPALYRVVEKRVEVEVEREVIVYRDRPMVDATPQEPAQLPPAPPRPQIEPYRPAGDPMNLSQAMYGSWPAGAQ